MNDSPVSVHFLFLGFTLYFVHYFFFFFFTKYLRTDLLNWSW